jgi:aerobic-type carbon monoxide dehydrogenase small subunit (CoxS/CutS family)
MLDRTKQPSLDDVRRALAGNICRCAAYNHIFEAALAAAKRMA